jgi:small subunit ribosomal protein S6
MSVEEKEAQDKVRPEDTGAQSAKDEASQIPPQGTQEAKSGESTVVQRRTGTAQRQRAQRVKRRPKKARQVIQVPEEEPLEARLRSYELLYLVDAGTGREEIDNISGGVVERIERNGGYAESVKVSEVRRLEYPIKRSTHGIYVLINFRALPSTIKEIETFLRYNEHVLRYLIVATRRKAQAETAV